MAEEGYRTGNLPDDFDSNDVPLFSAGEIQSVLLEGGAASSNASSTEPFILPGLPPVYHQLDINSCTANASCAALRFAYKNYTGKQYTKFEPSRLFAYYYGRITRLPENLSKNETSQKQIQELVKEDNGSNNRRIIHTFLMQGVCKEALWPYGKPISKGDPPVFDTSVVPNACEPANWAEASFDAKASSHPSDAKALSGKENTIPRAISFYRIYDANKTSDVGGNWQIIYNNPGVALLEKTLLSGWPFIFGTRLYKGANLGRAQIDQNGVYLKPSDNNTVHDIGGHAMMAVGFDKTRRLFLVQNSWGENWPENCKDNRCKGRFWMPYEWFEYVVGNRPTTYDYWVIKFGQ
jgi:hypothetical protein